MKQSKHKITKFYEHVIFTSIFVDTCVQRSAFYRIIIHKYLRGIMCYLRNTKWMSLLELSLNHELLESVKRNLSPLIAKLFVTPEVYEYLTHFYLYISL